MHFLEAKLTIAGMRIWANHILLSKRKNLKGKDKKAYFPVIDFWHRIIVGGQLPLFIAIGVSSLSPQSVAVLLKLVPLPSTGSKSPILPKKKSSFENLGLTNEARPIWSKQRKLKNDMSGFMNFRSEILYLCIKPQEDET